MKFIILSAITIFLFPQYTMASSDPVFRNFLWGTSVKNMPQTFYIDHNETYGPPECATVGKIKDEDLKIGDVNLDTIKYYFFDDKLARIGLWGSYRDFDKIKTGLTLKYGSYNQIPYNNSFDWKVGNVKISLIWWFQETYTVVYEHIPLKRQYDLCEKNLTKIKNEKLKESMKERHKKIMDGL